MSTNKTKSFFRRFYVKKSSMIFVIILFIISTMGVVLSSYNINEINLSEAQIESESTNTNVNGNNSSHAKLLLYNIIKDVFVVFSSTLGVNLLLSICVEKTNQNKAFEDFFIKDIISSSSFYNCIDLEQRKEMLAALEANVLFSKKSSKQIRSMLKSITDKLQFNEYIVENCEFDINCSFMGNYIEKEIIKKITVVHPYGAGDIKRLKLLRVSVAKIDGQKTVELKSVKVDHAEIDISTEISETNRINDNKIEHKSGYSNTTFYCLKKKLSFKNNESHTIEVNYITRVPLTDRSYLCRVSVPCKAFSLNFEILNNSDYMINAHAFGFIDDAKSSTNHDDIRKVNIKFDNWIFPGDGAAIFLNRKLEAKTSIDISDE